jgi:hypothetical protein
LGRKEKYIFHGSRTGEMLMMLVCAFIHNNPRLIFMLEAFQRFAGRRG